MCIDRVIEIRFSFSKFLSTNSQKTLTYIKMNLIHYFDDTRLKSMKLSDFNKHIIYTIFIYIERMIYETISVHTIHDQLHSVISINIDLIFWPIYSLLKNSIRLWNDITICLPFFRDFSRTPVWMYRNSIDTSWLTGVNLIIVRSTRMANTQ